MRFSFGSLVAGALLLPTSVLAQHFSTVAAYSVGGIGSNPRGVAISDFNQDGYLDVATANFSDATAGVLLNQGQGTFSPIVRYPLGSGHNPHDVAAGDVNQDGYPDLVLTEYISNQVGVLLNQRDGTFAPVVQYTLGGTQYAESLVVTDINHDHYPDVLTANLGSGTLQVLLNQGNGTLRLGDSYAVAPSPAFISLTTGDFNHDGEPDLAVASFNNLSATVQVLLNQRSGHFTLGRTYALGAGRQPYGLAAGDVTRDGYPDLVVGDLAGNAFLVLGNQQDGTFSPAVAYATGAGSQPFAVALSDIDSDGWVEVVTSHIGANTLGVWLNQPTGPLLPGGRWATGPNSEPSRLATGDLNQDGRPDLVVANSASGTIGVLLSASVLATQPSADLAQAQATVFPNPTAGPLVLTVTGLPAGARRLDGMLLDATGRAAASFSWAAVPGQLQGTLATASLVPGLYMLRLSVLNAQGTLVETLSTQRLNLY